VGDFALTALGQVFRESVHFTVATIGVVQGAQIVDVTDVSLTRSTTLTFTVKVPRVPACAVCEGPLRFEKHDCEIARSFSERSSHFLGFLRLQLHSPNFCPNLLERSTFV
jgi:hypothetical protein